MAKKKVEEKINLDSILFKCRDILRQARNSGSFFEKRDMMLTLVFLRFIGEKFEDGIGADGIQGMVRSVPPRYGRSVERNRPDVHCGVRRTDLPRHRVHMGA